MPEQPSLWQRFVGVVRRLWCWFVTIMVPVLVWMLVGYAIFKLTVAWIAFATTVIFAAAPTGIGDVVIIILFIIITIILIILLLYVLKELWDWTEQWMRRRVRRCRSI